jgi:ERCC4-related helicase
VPELEVGAAVSLLDGDGIVVEVHNDKEFTALTEMGEFQRQSLHLPLISLIDETDAASSATDSLTEISGTTFDSTADGSLIQLPAAVGDRPPEQATSVHACLEAGHSDPFELCRLRALASKLGMNPGVGEYQALSGNEIDIEPYQIDAAHTVLQADVPRFLIADEVGLGKTIETGIVLEELRARGDANRVLVVAPASLVEQWQNELADKFGQEYVIFDRNELQTRQQQFDQSAWRTANTIVTSIDFIKQEDIREQLRQVEWDVAVFDEAHHLTARRQNGYINPTDRYRVGQIVAERTDALLLLTGTPHKGKRDQFYYLLRLLRPHLFRDIDHVSVDRVNEVMIRRLKTDDDIVDEQGNPMFPPREISTLPVNLSEPEQALYDDVTEYIRDHYADRLSAGSGASNRIAGYALSVYQKRLVSSIRAIETSLRNHRAGLKATTNTAAASKADEQLLERYFKTPSALSEQERQRAEQIASNPYGDDVTGRLESDIDCVSSLIERASSLEQDSKAAAFRDFIDETLTTDPDEKVLVFTEYTDTLAYLRDVVLEEYDVAQIHGDLSQNRRREERHRFEEDAQVLVATDAAREGINLQFAHIMVNYDLPWNPIRIDQRIGRLHRYGQDRTVSVYNLFIEDSREDQICKQLIDKTKQIEEDLGIQSDVLGTVLNDVDIEQHVEDALREDRGVQQVVADLEAVVDDRIKAQQRVQEEFLTRDQFDVTDAERITELLQESDLESTVKNCRSLVEAFCTHLDGEVSLVGEIATDETKKDVVSITPPTILARKDHLKDHYPRVTFHQMAATADEQLSLISITHPLVEAILNYITETPRFGGHFGFGTHPSVDSGLFCRFTVQCEFDADTHKHDEKIVDIFVDDEGAVTTKHAFEQITATATEPNLTPELVRDLRSHLETAQEVAIAEANSFAEERQSERATSVSDRIDDVTGDYDDRIREWGDRINGYRKKAQAETVNMRAPINRAQARIEDLKTRKARTLENLRCQRRLNEVSVNLVTAIRTLPSS